MPRYRVYLSRSERMTLAVEADNMADAVSEAFDNAPAGFAPDDVEEVRDDDVIKDSATVVGSCECCGIYLLDCDDYTSDDEMIYVCAECFK